MTAETCPREVLAGCGFCGLAETRSTTDRAGCGRSADDCGENQLTDQGPVMALFCLRPQQKAAYRRSPPLDLPSMRKETHGQQCPKG